jgi:hypothetical protein
MEFLRRLELSIGLGITVVVREVVMSVNWLGASSGGRASAIGANFRRRLNSEAVLTVLYFVFVGVTAALFFAWLTSANTGGRASGRLSADADCVSFGRGGARCETDGGSNRIADARGDCISAGRGGLICDRGVAR